ncbi:MAG: LPS-assembly protein LptD [Gemmataceae bacterium]|nr:LPS-assembly protein LptD [Gemmataceae bacterium]
MVRRWLAICLGACAATAIAAPEVRAQPSPVIGLPVVSDPATDYPLSTDRLMAPPPVVPPRRSYQRPTPPTGAAGDPAAPPEPPGITLPDGAQIPLPAGGGRYFRFVPRYGQLNNFSSEKLTNGTQGPPTQRFVITGGVIVYVSPGDGQGEIEFATDDAVVWIRGQQVDNIAGGFEAGPENKREVEVYLSGNVIIRTVSTNGGQSFSQTLRSDQVYYDVSRNRAIAVAAELELNTPRVPDGVYLRGREIRRLDEANWEILKGSVFSSKLPADPGLRFDSPRITLRETKQPRRNFLGIPYRDFSGNPDDGVERLMTLRNSTTWLAGIPVFYFPYYRADVNEPLGPLNGVGGGQDRIFGTQFYTTWDIYKIIGIKSPPGHKWLLHLDYLSSRGPAAGTDYYYSLPPREDRVTPAGLGFARLYGINDTGQDVIGGGRGPLLDHPVSRGRALWRHQQEITDELYFQGQIAYLSDQNFLEQYYKQEFDLGPNQETFAYLTYQRENLWAGGLIQPKLGQNWITHTESLPKLDGAVVGQSFWDLFVYNARADATYAQLRPSQVNPFPVEVTDQQANSGRFDLNQDLSLPFALGPVKLAPYAVLDLADYTQHLTGNPQDPTGGNIGRVYGAGGLRGSLPLSRLYEEVYSELFNVRGLYHKVTVSGNYYYARTNVQFNQLPQFDRLNDDVTDYTFRYARPAQSQLVSGPAGVALATSPIFDPQQYAIRRLVDNRVDTLGNINVLQMDLRQRLQTKRGYPGLEHTVDWFTLDVSGSFFPDPNRDNFGKPFAFLEYSGLWNVGDRVSVLSAGWFDPFEFGTRYWNLGVAFDRTDRTSFYFGYRQTDPLNSKAVTASIGYQLSRRYYTSIGASYDFGIQKALSNSLTLTRTGADMTVTIGLTYNALVNNTGFTFMVIPNVLSALAPGRFSSIGMAGR